MADPYSAMATNPYLQMPQQEAPDWRMVLANMATGIGTGISQGAGSGQGWAAGLAPGIMMGNQLTGMQQQNAQQQAMKRWQMGLMAQEYGDKQQERDLKRQAQEADADRYLPPGLRAPQRGPQMGPNFGSPASAIAGLESGGRYDALGPETGKGRAYGKYQVMDFNVGPWTAEVLGKPMTPQEFLANPQAQDAVFQTKFGQYAQKHGNEGAAKAWFAGEGGMNNPDAADVNGMTVAKYAQKFRGQGDAPLPSPGVAQAPPQYVPPPKPELPEAAALSIYKRRRAGALTGAEARAEADKIIDDLHKPQVEIAQKKYEQDYESWKHARGQADKDAWVPLTEEEAKRKMIPFNKDKPVLLNTKTGDMKPLGGSLVTVNTGDAVLPGQKKVDEKFADQYIEFVTAGGFADSAKMLDQLKEVQTALKSGAKLTGPIIGLQDDALLSFTNPEAMAMRDAVFEVAQRNLRAILGPQFTAKEGEQLIARTYNPRLSEQENAKRIDRLMEQIKTSMEAKIDSAKYFEEHGTLRGWKGKMPSMADFDLKAADKEPPSPAEKPKQAPAAGFTKDGYRFKGGDPSQRMNWEPVK